MISFDGDFTVASPISLKLKSFPFERDNVSFITEQVFCQLSANFVPLPLNSQDPEDPLAFLVQEYQHADMGAGIIRWVRMYARVPQTRDDYESHSYVFPGWVAAYDSTYHSPWQSAGVSILPYFPITPAPTLIDPGRVPRAATVNSRLRHEYFLVGTLGQFQSAQDIPVIAAQRYTYGSTFGASAGGDVPDRLLWTEAGYTSPTTAEYKAMIAAGADIAVDDSIIRPWRGNIYERVTRTVKAQ